MNDHFSLPAARRWRLAAAAAAALCAALVAAACGGSPGSDGGLDEPAAVNPASASPWTVSTLAGSGSAGAADAAASAASFNAPWGLAAAADGTIYVADTLNHKIRKVSAAGVVSTLAGSGRQGAADASGTAASFNEPGRIALAADGSLLVTDTYGQKIRKVAASGAVTTLAGSGSAGAANGAAASASFNYPLGIATAADGSLYVADNANQQIRRIAADGSVSTFAGSGLAGFADGGATTASFNTPYGMAIDAQGVLYVADTHNQRIRRIAADGTVSTLAGSGTRGSLDGIGSAASFNDPQGIAIGADGSLYVADTSNHTIRQISSTGQVSTIAGRAGSSGATDGAGATARLNFPFDVAIDKAGVLYVADWGNNKVRRMVRQ